MNEKLENKTRKRKKMGAMKKLTNSWRGKKRRKIKEEKREEWIEKQ